MSDKIEYLLDLVIAITGLVCVAGVICMVIIVSEQGVYDPIDVAVLLGLWS